MSDSVPINETAPGKSGWYTAFLRFGPVTGMVLLVTFLSLAPAYFFHEVESSLPPVPGLDKYVHGLMYFVLTVSALYTLTPSERARLRSAILVALATSWYGALMEVVQGVFTTTRSLDGYDMLANTVGAFCGAFVLVVVARRKR